MVNILSTLGLLGAVATAAAVAVPRALDEQSPNTLMQAAQSLSLPSTADEKCYPHSVVFSIHNLCDFPMHVWRADSSVDKIAEMPPRGSRLVEPARQDWRSGLMTLRIAPDAMAPYKGSGLAEFRYLTGQTSNSGYIMAQGDWVFGNPISQYETSVFAIASNVVCKDKNGTAIAQSDFGMGAAFSCSKDISKGRLEIGVAFCTPDDWSPASS